MNTLADSRPPVSTYEQAIWWLVQHLPNDQLDFGINGLPLAAHLVADMFWTTHAQVARDFAKAYKTVNPSPLAPHRTRKGRR